MYELEIGEHIRSSFAYITPDDLRQGKERIYVGDMSSIPQHTDFVTEHIESVITHESTHIVIYKVTEDIPTVRCFDNIDNPMPEGGVYPISRGW